MTHYLRVDRHNTLVDIEATVMDISAVVCIEVFSSFLLGLWWWQRKAFIRDMEDVQEVRGTYHEQVPSVYEPDELAEKICKALATKWKLYYVTD